MKHERPIGHRRVRWVTLIIAIVLFSLVAPLPFASPTYANSCQIGFKTGAFIADSDIDGTLGTDWNDATLIQSGSPCLDALKDWNGTTLPPAGSHVSPTLDQPVKVYSKRDTNHLYMAFEVNDTTKDRRDPGHMGKTLPNGEKIIIQIDSNLSRGSQLENGASSIQKDYRIEVTHKWGPASVVKKFFDSTTSAAGSSCFTQDWHQVSSFPTGLKVAVGTSVGGYVVEYKIPLSLIGNPTTDIGVAFAVINDLGYCVGGTCGGDTTGIAFPNIPLNNTTAPLIDPVFPTHCPWLVPDDWGTGYFTISISDVWISHVPKYWQSQDLKAFPCNSSTPGYTYYPGNPCRLKLEATLHNSGSSDQTRNVLFLWADHGSSPSTWRFIALKENINVPSAGATVSTDPWNGVPDSLPNHPCVRVYILPPTFDPSFDRDDIKNISNQAQLQQMLTTYGLTATGPQSAQKNITRHSTGSTCPISGCGVSSLFDKQKLSSQPTLDDVQSPQLVVNPSAKPGAWLLTRRSILTALPILLFAGGLAAISNRWHSAVLWLLGNLHSNWKPLSVWLPIAVGLSLLIFKSCTPTPEPEPGGPIFLTDEEMELYGQDNVIVQVRSFGYSEPPVGEPPRYHFIEDLGGVLQMFPVDIVQEQGPIPFQMNVTNPGDAARTIFLAVDTYVPPGAKDVEIDIDTKPRIFDNGETRTVEGTVLRQERPKFEDLLRWLIIFILSFLLGPAFLWIRGRLIASKGTQVDG